MKHGGEVDAATVSKAKTEVGIVQAAVVAVQDGPDGKREVASELKAVGANSLDGESEIISEVEAEGAAAVGEQSATDAVAEGGREGVGVAEAADDMHKRAETNAGAAAQIEGLAVGAMAQHIADAEQQPPADEAAAADAQFGEDHAAALEADAAGGDAAATLPLTDSPVEEASSSSIA
jgi:hypothetical protein